jgi:uncharacterized protein GlcG (DUF336 family)
MIRSRHELDTDGAEAVVAAALAHPGERPVRVGDEVVGAVATSGETPDEDEDVSLAGAAASFSTTEVAALTASGARKIAAVVGSAATSRGVAVVDAGGELPHLWRPDAARVASVGVATDTARTATVPHTLVLASRLVIDKVYAGHRFRGRPSPGQLWADLADLHRRIKPDFDPTTPEASAASTATG